MPPLSNVVGRILLELGHRLYPTDTGIRVQGRDPTQPPFQQKAGRMARYLNSRRVRDGQPLIQAALAIRASNSTIPSRSGQDPRQTRSENAAVAQILEDTTN